MWAFCVASLRIDPRVERVERALAVARVGFCLCLREVALRRTRALALHAWQRTAAQISSELAFEGERLRAAQIASLLQGARSQLAARVRLPLTIEEDLSAAKAALQREMLLSKQVAVLVSLPLHHASSSHFHRPALLVASPILVSTDSPFPSCPFLRVPAAHLPLPFICPCPLPLPPPYPSLFRPLPSSLLLPFHLTPTPLLLPRRRMHSSPSLGMSSQL